MCSSDLGGVQGQQGLACIECQVEVVPITGVAEVGGGDAQLHGEALGLERQRKGRRAVGDEVLVLVEPIEVSLVSAALLG